MQQVKSGLANHGTAYFAFEQTWGKGQRNKQWLSAKNENLILSVVIEPALLIPQQFYLSIVSALAALNLFNNYTTNNFKIKWANDIFCSDRKTGGILIENVISGDTIKYSVIGFGLNINQIIFDESLKNPASLKQITGKTYDVIELAKELCSIFQNKYFRLMNGEIKELMNEYNNHLYKKNVIVKFKKGSRVFDARIIEVNVSGRLIVKTMYEEVFELGSVEWIIE